MLADIKPGSNFCEAVAAFSYPLNSFNLELFRECCLLVHKHLFHLLNLRVSGVYKTRGDSEFVFFIIADFFNEPSN